MWIVDVGMLWTVCDTFSDATSKHVVGQGTDRAVSPSIHEDRPALHSMWPTMLFELRSLAVDFRPEVGNNLLFTRSVTWLARDWVQQRYYIA